MAVYLSDLSVAFIIVGYLSKLSPVHSEMPMASKRHISDELTFLQLASIG